MVGCSIDACSLLSVETADRPGLLLEILKVICDISIFVESAEIDTEVNFLNETLVIHVTSLVWIVVCLPVVFFSALFKYLRLGHGTHLAGSCCQGQVLCDLSWQSSKSIHGGGELVTVYGGALPLILTIDSLWN